MKGDFDYLIGSGAACDIKVPRSTVEEEHARLRRRGDRLFIQDLSYRHGVTVNQDRIRPKRWVEITRFDEVRLGDRLLELGAKLFIGRHRLGVHTTPLHLQAKTNETLCDGVFLQAEPGTLTAVMGPSGCGKSVLLNLLSGIYRPDSGEVLLGEDCIPLYQQQTRLAEFIGFVPQAEVLLAELTVAQSLDYRLRLVQPDTDAGVRNRLIRHVCERLGFTGEALERFLHTRIGAPDEKGRVLSGGQRRRASIAHELITQPLVLFLDEPTSGLSSADSDEIIGLLKHLAERDGITMVATLHQPSQRAYRCFDQLLLMGAGGRCLYQGEAQVADQLLLGERVEGNPAEQLLAWATEVTTPVNPLTVGVAPASEEASAEMGARARTSSSGIARKFAKAIRQGVTLLQRNGRVFLNDRSNLWFSVLQVPVLAVLFLVLFHGAGADHAGADHFVRTVYQFEQSQQQPVNTADALRKALASADEGSPWISESSARQRATVYFVLSLTAIWFGLMGACREIVTEQAVIAREARAGVSPWAVLKAKWLVQSLVACLQVVGILALLQPVVLRLSGEAFVFLLIGLCLTASVAASLGLFLSALGKTYRTVLTLVPLIMIPQVLFGGLLRVFESASAASALSLGALSRWSFQWILAADPRAERGVLRLNPPSEPETPDVGIAALMERLVSLSETGLNALFFPANSPEWLPCAALLAAVALCLTATRLILGLRLKV